MTSASPTVRRRELGARLRALRLKAGLTVEDVAGRVEVSAAKISRIETAARGVNINDIRALCELYEVTADERERLLSLARESRRRSWWQQYGLDESVATYVGLEDAAVAIQQYETSLVPPLLQTEAYARAVTAGTGPWLSEEQVEELVATRMTRQALLAADRPLDLWTILDESALRRLVGGAPVMREQLDQLVGRSRSPRVTVQVIGLEAGAHPGMDSAFAVLQLEEVTDVVYVEGLMGYFFLQHQGDVVRYRRAFEQLRAVALSPSDSRDRIRAVAATLPA